MKEAILLSIKIGTISTIITLVIGVALARFFSKRKFWGKELIEAFFILPMIMPPSVTGFILLKLLGTNGFIGRQVESLFGSRILFTWQGVVIAASVVSFPIMYQSCKAGFLSVDKRVEDVARTLGAKEGRVFWKIALPLAFPTIISGIVLSFARAIGEFGATLMIGGNIAGETRTIPIAIFFATESGNEKMAMALTLFVVIYGVSVIFALNHWIRIQNKYE